MLHLRNTLPRFFDPDQSTSTLFPADIFSPHMSLKLHHPIPLKVSSSPIHPPSASQLRSSFLPKSMWQLADRRSRHFRGTPSPLHWHEMACRVSWSSRLSVLAFILPVGLFVTVCRPRKPAVVPGGPTRQTGGNHSGSTRTWASESELIRSSTLGSADFT